jgi:hypothetical protein
MADAILAELQRITRLAAGPIDANDKIKSAFESCTPARTQSPPGTLVLVRFAGDRSGLLKPIVCERLN